MAFTPQPIQPIQFQSNPPLANLQNQAALAEQRQAQQTQQLLQFGQLGVSGLGAVNGLASTLGGLFGGGATAAGTAAAGTTAGTALGGAGLLGNFGTALGAAATNPFVLGGAAALAGGAALYNNSPFVQNNLPQLALAPFTFGASLLFTDEASDFLQDNIFDQVGSAFDDVGDFIDDLF